MWIICASQLIDSGHLFGHPTIYHLNQSAVFRTEQKSYMDALYVDALQLTLNRAWMRSAHFQLHFGEN